MFCKSCGAEIPDNASYCINCGESYVKTNVNPEQNYNQQIYIQQNQPQNSSVDTMAVLGLVFSLINLCGLGSILGLVFSILGLKSEKNKGLAIAGLIISIIGLVAMFIFILIAILSPEEFDYNYFRTFIRF